MGSLLGIRARFYQKMVNSLEIYQALMHAAVTRLAGLRPNRVETGPGTVLNIWAPARPGGRPAVVLLHSFAGDGMLTWQFQVPALCGEYDVYVPDLVFFGGSTTEGPRRSPEFQAESVAEGLRRLGVGRCVLVGLSYGGMVAFRMAEMFPEMVEAVVASDTVTALTESISEAALERIGGYGSWSELLLPETVGGLKAMLEVGSYKLPWLPDFLCRHILETLYQHRKERSQLLEALVISDKNFSVPQHPKRVYFLCGENDIIFDTKVVDDMKKQLGERATVQLIEKAGHLVVLERPFVYNTHLKNILETFFGSINQKK